MFGTRSGRFPNGLSVRVSPRCRPRELIYIRDKMCSRTEYLIYIYIYINRDNFNAPVVKWWHTAFRRRIDKFSLIKVSPVKGKFKRKPWLELSLLVLYSLRDIKREYGRAEDEFVVEIRTPRWTSGVTIAMIVLGVSF